MKPLILGTDAAGGQMALRPDERRTHMHVIGSSGSGKSKFLECLIRQDLTSQQGFCQIDPHGTLYRDVLDYCAHHVLKRDISRGDVPRFLKALAHSAGIQKHVTPHLLRHTFCTNLRNNGADISLIKELAGHQEIQTTARYYLGTDTEVLKQAVGRYLDYSAPKAEEPAAAPSTS